MRAPLTFVGEKKCKVTAVYPATDYQSCTCKLNLDLFYDCKIRDYVSIVRVSRVDIYGDYIVRVNWFLNEVEEFDILFLFGAVMSDAN